MKKEKIYIFDTTLRDGAQTQGVDFNVTDKLKIAEILSNIGVDYIEGGWPGANPVDNEFFSNPPKLKKSIFTASKSPLDAIGNPASIISTFIESKTSAI